jgi:uncharacterized protein YdaT
MPWTAKDAPAHNRHATGKRARQWADVANSVLGRTGDEGRAVREANAAIKPFARTDAAAAGRADRVLEKGATRDAEVNQVAPHMIGGWG